MTRERATRPGEPGTWDRAAEQTDFDARCMERDEYGDWFWLTWELRGEARARWLSTRALEER